MWAADEESAGRALDRVTSLIRAYAIAFLAGDRSVYERALADRRQRGEDLTAKAMIGTRRLEGAEHAWRAKDYDTVHELLEPVRGLLDEHHLRRLRFAAARRRPDPDAPAR
jgi:hypothetical protein